MKKVINIFNIFKNVLGLGPNVNELDEEGTLEIYNTGNYTIMNDRSDGVTRSRLRSWELSFTGCDSEYNKRYAEMKY